MKTTVFALCALILICSAAYAAPDTHVASIKTVTGMTSITREGKVITVKGDEWLYKGDALKTSADGSVGIIFKDGTVLSLGPSSEVVIDEFLFSPAQDRLAIVTRLLKGTATYLSGIIGRLSPQSVRFETPVATVGIRGTRFLVKVDDE